jgi:hypothetical protein
MEHVLTGDMDQQASYDTMMPFFLDKFSQGYNVNFLCSGQTGSGKTHTAIGPPGTFRKGVTTNEIQPIYGMFPRMALEIFNLAQSKGAMCTLALCQDYFSGINCMMKDRMLKVDEKENTLTGIHEEIVETAD